MLGVITKLLRNYKSKRKWIYICWIQVYIEKEQFLSKVRSYSIIPIPI